MEEVSGALLEASGALSEVESSRALSVVAWLGTASGAAASEPPLLRAHWSPRWV